MTTPKEVNVLHTKSDLDMAPGSQHHTLGIKPTQASPGDHTHNGRNSKPIDPTAFTVLGSRGGNEALTSLITALVAGGYIADATSP